MIAYIKCGMSLPLIILSLLSTWRVGRDSLVPSCGLGLGAGLRLRCRDDRGSHDGTGNMKTMPRAGVHGARWWIFNTVVCKPSIYTTLSSYGQSNGPSLVDFLQWCHCSLAWLLSQILLCESPPRPLCVWKWLLVKTPWMKIWLAHVYVLSLEVISYAFVNWRPLAIVPALECREWLPVIK